MPDQSALLAHIVSQTRQNVEFLISQNELSHADGQAILAKLPSRGANANTSILANQMGRMTMTLPEPSVGAVSVAPPVRNVPPPAQPAAPRLQRAKAIWAYNENGAEPNDLSFRTGDIVEIVAETNADWWTGRANGREGLFPSNYVEKLPGGGGGGGGGARAPSPTPQYSAPTQPLPGQSSYGPPPPSQYGAPMPYQSPPPQQQQPYPPPAAYPPQQGYQVQQQPPPQQVVVVQEQQPEQPQKQSRFGGKYGNLLATSAVGGVGFGAGSAVGSGIINAIF